MYGHGDVMKKVNLVTFTNAQHNAAVQTGEKLVKTLSVTEGTILDSEGNEYAQVTEDTLLYIP